MTTSTVLASLNAPRFTPASPPRCRFCAQPTVFRTVLPSNPDGNAGRPYFICCSCPNFNVGTSEVEDVSTEGSQWVTWNDTVGVEDGNPKCWCGNSSRYDQVGAASTSKLPPKTGFYSCAWGDCGFYVLAKSVEVKNEDQVAHTGLVMVVTKHEKKDGLAAGEEMKQETIKEEDFKGEDIMAAEPRDKVEEHEAEGWEVLGEIKEEK
ncbi:hypothetical protein N431DRAFT_76209 [Stipitochalara longipes BDJ]|nr:hypothetical protein N431DRAFT_76209 [Stipitochalara longipes BDJ]